MITVKDGAPKKFYQKDFTEALEKAGHVRIVPELEKRTAEGKPPDGTPRKAANGAMVYPRPHFV